MTVKAIIRPLARRAGRGLEAVVYHVGEPHARSCPLCAPTGLPPPPRGPHLGSPLEPAEIAAIAASVGRLETLELRGIEPRLGHDLDAAVHAFLDAAAVANLLVVTHGARRDATVAFLAGILARYPKLRLFVEVTLDHAPADAPRHLCPGAVEFVDRLKRLRASSRPFHISAHTTLRPENAEGIPELYDQAGRLDLDAHFFEMQYPERIPPAHHDLRAFYDSREEIVRLYRTMLLRAEADCRARRPARGLGPRLRELERTAIQRLIGRTVPRRIRHGAWGGIACLAGAKCALLAPDGVCRICELRPDGVSTRRFALNLPATLRAPELARQALEKRPRRGGCNSFCPVRFNIESSLRHTLAGLLRLLPAALLTAAFGLRPPRPASRTQAWPR